MKTIACEQGLAVAMLWLAGQLTIWGIRLENAAQQRAAARTEQQAQRRAAACKNVLAAGRRGVYQAGRAEWQAGQRLGGRQRGRGERAAAACDNL